MRPSVQKPVQSVDGLPHAVGVPNPQQPTDKQVASFTIEGVKGERIETLLKNGFFWRPVAEIAAG
jgi:hypothetical protein